MKRKILTGILVCSLSLGSVLTVSANTVTKPGNNKTTGTTTITTPGTTYRTATVTTTTGNTCSRVTVSGNYRIINGNRIDSLYSSNAYSKKATDSTTYNPGGLRVECYGNHVVTGTTNYNFDTYDSF